MEDKWKEKEKQWRIYNKEKKCFPFYLIKTQLEKSLVKKIINKLKKMVAGDLAQVQFRPGAISPRCNFA